MGRLEECGSNNCVNTFPPRKAELRSHLKSKLCSQQIKTRDRCPVTPTEYTHCYSPILWFQWAGRSFHHPSGETVNKIVTDWQQVDFRVQFQCDHFASRYSHEIWKEAVKSALRLVSDVKLLVPLMLPTRDAQDAWDLEPRSQDRIKAIKRKLATHQTKWISNFQKACISPKMVDRKNRIELNKSTYRYTTKHGIFSYL